MGTARYVYVRLTDPVMIERILGDFPASYTEPNASYYEIKGNLRYYLEEMEILRLSVEYQTDVILLYFQSSADAFEFRHWSRGAYLRTLVFGCDGPEERTWEQIEGDPEPWESLVPLSPDKMSPGHEDSLNSRETARIVAKYYRLPGWSLISDDS